MQRTFSPASSTIPLCHVPFDPTQSFHATHVAGIAAGEPTLVAGHSISGVAPNAYLGNYKALTIPTPDSASTATAPSSRRRSMRLSPTG